jgi:hypothetical protein
MNSGGMVEQIFKNYLATGDAFYGNFLNRSDTFANTAQDRAFQPVGMGQNAANFEATNSGNLLVGQGDSLAAGLVGAGNANAYGQAGVANADAANYEGIINGIGQAVGGLYTAFTQPQQQTQQPFSFQAQPYQFGSSGSGTGSLYQPPNQFAAQSTAPLTASPWAF